jgi:hypothetical protein
MKINSLKEAKQAAFNGAVRGLASQGWKQSSSDDGCVLNRGTPGIHCAIGWLIPWDSQKHLANNSETDVSIMVEEKILPDALVKPLRDFVKDYTKDSFYQFLGGLQSCHDNSEAEPRLLLSSFREFGRSRRLTWPSDVPRTLENSNADK